MTFELAKQLKDAGFPQKRESKFVRGQNAEIDHFLDQPEKPTITELIEECRRLGGYIGFALLWSKTAPWTAELRSLADCPKAEGMTPEEAVAKLWLKVKEADTNA